jgi:putative hydrolase of the HAD superfamily
MNYNAKTTPWVWIDLDDTLWDFAANSHDALAQVYDSLHLNRVFPTLDNWREAYYRHNHALWDVYNVGDITKDELLYQRIYRPLAEYNADTEEINRICSAFDEEYLGRLGRCERLVPGALELLNHLKTNGYHIGILSNGFKGTQSNKLKSSHIDHFIDLMVLSDDIGVNKPDRRLYDYAVAQAHTSSAESLMIGDNPDTDILGAVNAGWKALYFNRLGKPCSLPGVPIFDSLLDLIPLFS